MNGRRKMMIIIMEHFGVSGNRTTCPTGTQWKRSKSQTKCTPCSVPILNCCCWCCCWSVNRKLKCCSIANFLFSLFRSLLQTFEESDSSPPHGSIWHFPLIRLWVLLYHSQFYLFAYCFQLPSLYRAKLLQGCRHQWRHQQFPLFRLRWRSL